MVKYYLLSNYELVTQKDSFYVFATIPEEDALDESFNSVYTNKYLNDINIEFEVLGYNVNYDECCSCKKSSWYMLYTDFTTDESP